VDANTNRMLNKLNQIYEKWFNQLDTVIIDYSLRLLFSLLIITLGIWLAKKISQLAYQGMKARNVDPTIRRFVDKVIHVAIVVLAVITSLSQLGIQTTTIIAALGAVGLAVALALQASLSNFAAGLLLVMFRPCKVGDYVETGTAGGTVRAINLLYTSLLTGDNKVITIPNSHLLNTPLTNFSTMPKRRIDLTLDISYESDIEHAKAVIQSVIAQETRIINNPEPLIAVQLLSENSIKLISRSWVKTEDYWPVTFAMNELIKTGFDQAGIKMPARGVKEK
jgi:small conductance mechanosensitive channel